ncbi:MAG: lipopolysaccharide transport periplasmic protein LptA [Chromatiales bacterium]|nr:lipopolysaccharide transport periplasmic protein LptA [Gammaproteobacteria bacterium]MBW6476215.1 lipopolysaccharide transport periplasmic protein LptA [Chromatiales bacterium]
MYSKPSAGSLVLALLLALPLGPLCADEAPAPISIEADRLEISQPDGRSLYQGQVVLQQGELRLEADTLQLQQQQGQLQRAIADGTPVRLQLPDDQSAQLIRAQALHMDYDISNNSIELKGEAVLWRGGDEFRGQLLRYNIEQRSVQASGHQPTDGSDGRVRIILQPESQP